MTPYMAMYLIPYSSVGRTVSLRFRGLARSWGPDPGRFDEFIEVYNNDWPHQALGGQYPGEVYTPSAREYRPPERPEYPFHDRTIRVTQCGRLCIGRRKINFSNVFGG
jgi:hypothetical protein